MTVFYLYDNLYFPNTSESFDSTKCYVPKKSKMDHKTAIQQLFPETQALKWAPHWNQDSENQSLRGNSRDAKKHSENETASTSQL